MPFVNIFSYLGTDIFMIPLKSIRKFSPHFSRNFASQMQELPDIRIVSAALYRLQDKL